MTSSFTGSLFRSRVSVRSSCSLPSLLFLPFAAIFPPPPGPALKTDGMANDEEEGSAEEEEDDDDEEEEKEEDETASGLRLGAEALAAEAPRRL